MSDSLPSTKILGTKITNAKKEEILEYIFKRIENKSKKFYIVTPNPEILVYAARSSSFKKILNGADISLADGIGVVLADKILKSTGLERITGVDMMEMICALASKKAVTVGFLGGRDSVAKKTAECLVRKYPHLRVNFVGEEWIGEETGPATSHPHPTASLRDSQYGRSMGVPRSVSPVLKHIDILFVAFGFPKQEEWIAKHLQGLPVTAAMGVGGAFDYFSGKVPRAPKVVRDIGMEWAFRLARQPWRIKRQLALPVFIFKVLIERLKGEVKTI